MIKKKKPHKYRSGFEQDFHKLYPELAYEPEQVTYERKSTHKYLPDFVSASGKFLIETKGRMRNSAESRKYLYIREHLQFDSALYLAKGYYRQLCFIFMKPETPMPGARRRKDGTKLSHGEWATKNGFKWATMADMPREWRE